MIEFDDHYNTKVSKISNKNIKDITMEYSEDQKFKKSKIVRFNQNQENNNDNEEKVFSLNKNTTRDFINSYSSQKIKEIGFELKLNKNKFLNVELNSTRSVFSETSINFDIDFSTENKNKIPNDNITLNFETRLKINKKSFQEEGNYTDTTCVQYNSDKELDLSCVSWYDQMANEVICKCNKKGLIVNIMDQSVSFLSKLKQFPQIDSDLCI